MIVKIGYKPVPFTFDLIFDSLPLDSDLLYAIQEELICADDKNAKLIETNEFRSKYLFTLKSNNNILIPHFYFKLAGTSYIAKKTIGLNNEATSVFKLDFFEQGDSLEKNILIVRQDGLEISLYHCIDLYLNTADLEKTTFQEFVDAESFEVKAKEFLSSSSNSNLK